MVCDAGWYNSDGREKKIEKELCSTNSHFLVYLVIFVNPCKNYMYILSQTKEL